MPKHWHLSQLNDVLDGIRAYKFAAVSWGSGAVTGIAMLFALGAVFMTALPSAGRAGSDRCDPSTNADRVREAREASDKADQLNKMLALAGLQPPPLLKKAIDRYTVAFNAGIDIAEAAGQADFELQKIAKDRKILCALGDQDEVAVCEAKVDRLRWGDPRAAIDWSNAGSVFRRVAAKWADGTCSVKPNPVCDDIIKQMTAIGSECSTDSNGCNAMNSYNSILKLQESVKLHNCNGF